MKKGLSHKAVQFLGLVSDIGPCIRSAPPTLLMLEKRGYVRIDRVGEEVVSVRLTFLGVAASRWHCAPRVIVGALDD